MSTSHMYIYKQGIKRILAKTLISSSTTKKKKMSTTSNSSTKTIRSKFKKWVGYNFCFCKGVFFASGLVFSDKLIEYSILALLITYVVEKKKTREIGDPAILIRNTAIFAVIQEGLSALLEIFMIFISNALFGRFIVITVSSFFYIIGLVLLYHGSGKDNISRFDIFGILLLAVGKAGLRPLIREFIADQYRNHEPDPANPDEDRVIARKNLCCRVVWAISAVAAFLIHYFYSLWSIKFGISACATGASLILFWCGIIRVYHSGGLADTRSRITTGLRNLKAFLVKVKTRSREDDKDSSPSREKQKKERKKQCKKIFKMGCMWSTFLLFGLVLSAGKTYFPFTGINMDHTQYLPLLVVIQSISRKVISYMFDLILSKWVPEAKQTKAKLVRIFLGMLLAIPCFILARHIDKLVQKEEPSVFLLVPQFCLLGFMEGLAQDGLDEFMIGLFPQSRKDYVSAINTFVIGLGNIGNIISFYAYGTSFGLNKYFFCLIIVGAANLGYYLLISIIIYFKSKRTEEASQAPGKIETDERSQPVNTGDVESSQTEGLEFNTEGEDHEHQRSKKAGLDSTGEETRDQEKQCNCTDLLSSCF